MSLHQPGQQTWCCHLEWSLGDCWVSDTPSPWVKHIWARKFLSSQNCISVFDYSISRWRCCLGRLWRLYALVHPVAPEKKMLMKRLVIGWLHLNNLLLALFAQFLLVTFDKCIKYFTMWDFSVGKGQSLPRKGEIVCVSAQAGVLPQSWTQSSGGDYWLSGCPEGQFLVHRGHLAAFSCKKE